MSTVLSRGNGSSSSWTTQELNAIIVALEGSNSASKELNGVAFVRISQSRILLIDTNTNWGRKLYDIFLVDLKRVRPCLFAFQYAHVLAKYFIRQFQIAIYDRIVLN